MCFTWNLIHCIAILIYNSAIRLYPLVLEFCLYIMATSRKKSEVWEQGSHFSPWKGVLYRGIGDYFVVFYLCKVITISHRKASQIASPASYRPLIFFKPYPPGPRWGSGRCVPRPVRTLGYSPLLPDGLWPSGRGCKWWKISLAIGSKSTSYPLASGGCTPGPCQVIGHSKQVT